MSTLKTSLHQPLCLKGRSVHFVLLAAQKTSHMFCFPGMRPILDLYLQL
jgi:hypothetical protein